MIKLITSFLFLLFLTHSARAQQQINDSLKTKKSTFKYESLIIPTAFISYGVISLSSNKLQEWDRNINTNYSKQGKHKGMIDEYIQYAPTASVYALNALGIEGKHRFKQRTLILGTAAIIASVPVTVLKNQRLVVRPNGKNKFSFPSGHTANAFLGAEFLRQEYKDVSIWYGISGYAVATATGIFRIYNNNHWLSDVVAGAGIGILATKIAYWIYPLLEKAFFKKTEAVSGIVAPYYNGNDVGLSMTALW